MNSYLGRAFSPSKPGLICAYQCAPLVFWFLAASYQAFAAQEPFLSSSQWVCSGFLYSLVVRLGWWNQQIQPLWSSTGSWRWPSMAMDRCPYHKSSWDILHESDGFSPKFAGSCSALFTPILSAFAPLWKWRFSHLVAGRRDCLAVACQTSP